MMDTTNHQIVLKEGEHFDKNYPHYFQSICSSFSLIDYFTNVCLIRVEQRNKKLETGQIVTHFTSYNIKNGSKYDCKLKELKNEGKDSEWKIDYQLQVNEKTKQNENDQYKENIGVTIKKEQDKIVRIDIEQKESEKNSLLKKLFDQNINTIDSLRLSPKLIQSKNMLSYFYREGENDKNITQENANGFLVFDWGGLEAVGLLGAMKTLSRKIQGMKFVKSIICSGFGGLVGLSIACHQQFGNQKNYDVTNEISKLLLNVEERNEKKKQPKQEQDVLTIVAKKNKIDEELMSYLKQTDANQTLVELIWSLHPSLNDENLHNESQQELTSKQKQKLVKSKAFSEPQNYKQKALIILSKYDELLKKDDKLSMEFNKPLQKSTLKQFYDITKIQFTFTALDLTHRIIRFLNHKTTPKLPLCEAISISSASMLSYPRKVWQKDWGKYYVHYDIYRVQIDLEGCQLSSGGQVIPYPINYIDNQTLRPKYFNHCFDKKNSSLVGFSLSTDHKEYKQKSEEHDKKIREQIGKILKVFSGYLKQQLRKKGDLLKCQKSLQELVQKLINLPRVLMEAEHNLNKEYFTENTNFINVRPHQHSPLNNNLKITDFYNEKDLSIEVVLKNIECIKSMAQDLTEGRILDTLTKLKLIYFPLLCEKQVIINPDLKQKVKKIEKFAQDNIFWVSCIQSQSQQLRNICKEMQEIIKKNQKHILRIVEKQSKKVKNLIKILDEDGFCIGQKNSFEKARNMKKISKLIFVVEIKNENGYFSDFIHAFNSRDQETSANHFLMLEERRIRNFYTEVFLRKDIFLPGILRPSEESKSLTNIHIVLESSPQSYKYVIPYLQTVEECLLEHSLTTQKLQMQNADGKKGMPVPKIRYITVSGFNSIPAILYTSSLNSETIEKKVFSIVKEIENTKRLQTYQKFAWMISQKHLFSEDKKLQAGIQQFVLHSLQSLSANSGEDKLYRKMAEIEERKEIIIEELNYFYDAIIQFVQNNSEGALSVQNFNPETLTTLVQFVGAQIFNDFFSSSAFSKDYFSFFSNADSNIRGKTSSEKLYYAVLCSHMLLTSSIRKFIGQILEMMKLSPDITLSEYFKVSPRKIQINFSVYEVNEGNITFLNKENRPKMPVWAALLASFALPIFFPPCKDKQHWVSSQKQNLTLKHAYQQFNQEIDPKFSGRKRFFSADYLNRLPIQVISNRLVRQATSLYQNAQIICMAIQHQRVSKPPEKQESKAKQKIKVEEMIRKLVKFSDTADLSNISIVTWVIKFYRNILNPNKKLFLDLYDNFTCQLHSMPPQSMVKNRDKNNKQLKNKYIIKAEIMAEAHFFNFPLRKFSVKIVIKKSESASLEISLRDKPKIGKVYLRYEIVGLENQQKLQKYQDKQEWKIEKSVVLKQRKDGDIEKNIREIRLKMKYQSEGKNIFQFQNRNLENLGKMKEEEKQFQNLDYHIISLNSKFLSTLNANQEYEFLVQCNLQNSTVKTLPCLTTPKPKINIRDINVTFKYFVICIRKIPENAPKKVPKKEQYQLQFLYNRSYDNTATMKNKILIKKRQPQAEEQRQEKQEKGEIEQDEQEGVLIEDVRQKKKERRDTDPITADRRVVIKKNQYFRFSTYFFQEREFEKKSSTEPNQQEASKEYERLVFYHKMKILDQFKQEDPLFFLVPYNSQSYKTVGLQKLGILLEPVLNRDNNLRNLSQKQLICPVRYHDKKQLVRVNKFIEQTCSCCLEQNRRILLKCSKCKPNPNCSECPKECPKICKNYIKDTYICAMCIYLFKDDDNDPYTCPYCSEDISQELKKPTKDIKITQCWQCKLISRSHFYDPACKYSFCQKCFKNLYRLHK